MRCSWPGKMRASEQGRQRLPIAAAVAAGVTVVATFAGGSAGKPSAGPLGSTGAGSAVSGAAVTGSAVAVKAGMGAREVAVRQAAQAAEDGSQVLPVDPGAGRLRQTQAFPSTHDAAFRAAMDDL